MVSYVSKEATRVHFPIGSAPRSPKTVRVESLEKRRTRFKGEMVKMERKIVSGGLR